MTISTILSKELFSQTEEGYFIPVDLEQIIQIYEISQDIQDLNDRDHRRYLKEFDEVEEIEIEYSEQSFQIGY